MFRIERNLIAVIFILISNLACSTKNDSGSGGPAPEAQRAKLENCVLETLGDDQVSGYVLVLLYHSCSKEPSMEEFQSFAKNFIDIDPQTGAFRLR